jgi:hypothetical protein
VCENCVYPWVSNKTDPWQILQQVNLNCVTTLTQEQVNQLLAQRTDSVIPSTGKTSERNKFQIDKLQSFWNMDTYQYDFPIHYLKPLYRLRQSGFFKKWNRLAQNSFNLVVKTCLQTLLQHTVPKTKHLITQAQFCATLNCLSMDRTMLLRALRKVQINIVQETGIILAAKRFFSDFGIQTDAKGFLVNFIDLLAEDLHVKVLAVHAVSTSAIMITAADVKQASQEIYAIRTLLTMAE